MSLQDKIKSLQNRPYESRLKFLWTAVAITAVAILLIWALTLRYRGRVNHPAGESKFQPLLENIKKLKQGLY